MAHTNSTAHYHLPQYVGTDIINPLTDTNKAYEDIDTALYEQGQSIAGVVDDIDALKIQNGDSALDTTAQTLSGAINELKSGADALGLRVTSNETNIGTLQTQMSTATGNITTLNTSVAGLQTEVASKASATAVDNLTTKVGTGNLDTVAQNCVDAINEVNAKIPQGGSVEADDVVYDNTDSGLTATNVQSAIDEIDTNIGNLSNLATTEKGSVVGAINEIAGGHGKVIASFTGDGTTTHASAFNQLTPNVIASQSYNIIVKFAGQIFQLAAKSDTEAQFFLVTTSGTALNTYRMIFRSTGSLYYVASGSTSGLTFTDGSSTPVPNNATLEVIEL